MVNNMEWKTATIFISSTFNDMHAERDYLIKEVFPEFREWCEERNIRMNEIDLRWGVSEDDSKKKNTIKKCLEHIDKSRPFFLCFLGQRRGWIPDFSKDISDDTTNLYGQIGSYDGQSATEMEILHSILNPLDKTIEDDSQLTEKEVERTLLSPLYEIMADENKLHYFPTKYSLFYFRGDSYLEDIKNIENEDEYIHKRLIYTNDSENDNDYLPDYTAEDADIALKEFKQKIINKKISEDEKDEKDKINMCITGYSGKWDEDLILPELKPIKISDDETKYTHNEMQGRLTNFVGDSKVLEEISDFKNTECDGESLKKIILNQLISQFEEEFADHLENFKSPEELSDEEKDLNQQEIFTYVNSEGYIEREEYDKELNNYVNSDEDRILLISAKAGLGKTMLLANFAKNFNDNYNDIKLYKRFCGASDLSSQTLSLWKSILYEAGITEDDDLYPNNTDELKRNMPDILNAIASKGPSLIVIDAINQIPNGIYMLKWLKKLPNNLKMIISIKEDEEDKEFHDLLTEIKDKKELFHNFELKELEDEKIVGLIENYLNNYLKELSKEQIEIIKSSDGSKNPLYLKILLAELRVFGSFEQLQDEISEFGENPKTAFDHVLDRLEKDEKYLPGDNIVPLIFSYLAYARVGLSEDELVSLIYREEDINLERDEIKGAVNVTLRQVRPFMAIKEKRHDFFYESFKLASQEKYKKNEIEINQKLADYFKDQITDETSDSSNIVFKDFSDSDFSTKILKARDYNELPYHLAEANDIEGLEEVLSSYSFIKNKLNLSDISNLISDYDYVNWNELSDSSSNNEESETTSEVEQNTAETSTSEETVQKEDHPLVLIQRALELSSPVLLTDKDQIAAQLWGRMNGIDEDIIQKLLGEIEEDDSSKWLKSSNTALNSPKGSIIKRPKVDGTRSSSVILSTDDKKLILANADGTLNLYDLNKNTLELIREGDYDKIIKLIPLEDNKVLVAYENGKICELDINNMSLDEDKYPKIDAKITDVYYSKTYEKIYASSYEGIFSIDINTKESKREDVENKEYNHILVPRLNESILVADNKEVDGWDVYEMRKSYNQHHQRELSEDGEEDFSVSKDASGDIKFMGLIKRFLILISENGQMKIWNTLKNSSSESIDEEITSSLSDQFAQAITIDDERPGQVITISENGLLRVYNIPYPQVPKFDQLKEIETGISSPSSIDYISNDKDKWLIVGNNDNDINVIDLKKEIKSDKSKKHKESVISIKVHGNEMITASENNEVFIWDFEEEEFKNEFNNPFRNTAVSLNQSKKQIVAAGTRKEDEQIKNVLSLWNIDDIDFTDEEMEAHGEETNPYRIIDVTQNSSKIIFIEDHKEKSRLVLANIDGKLDFNEKEEYELDGIASTLCSVFDSDDVFVGFEDGRIAKLSNGSLIDFNSDAESKANKIKLTDNNLAVAYDDGLIKIFDFDGNLIKTLESHEKGVNNLSSDDKHLASVSKDKTLKIWDLDSGECIYTYFLDNFATSVHISGDKVVTGDILGNVRFFKFV